VQATITRQESGRGRGAKRKRVDEERSGRQVGEASAPRGAEDVDFDLFFDEEEG